MDVRVLDDIWLLLDSSNRMEIGVLDDIWLLWRDSMGVGQWHGSGQQGTSVWGGSRGIDIGVTGFDYGASRGFLRDWMGLLLANGIICVESS
ncbi:hypothetical protein L6452_01429 [Arctium lappa]|uniref:Uncharacterized protein n=1 Tax=Arctium lappa TaxID=4217 RepID=A0ACB9FH33_ARCLA|nr:hypothetical protein L6452_01429 [Arctium lappa]